MDNEKRVPKLRFPGFTDAWEQRKLGDESIEILAGGDIDKNKVTDNGKYPIYANALTNDGIVGYYNDYYRVKAPAVTVTGRGDVGHAQARVLDFTPVVRLLAVRSNHDCYFLENAINNHSVIVESTGVPQLTVPQLSSYDILFPKSIKEESKIGDFFHKFDNLITLHQRKLEHTKELKKSLLNKMFPKNDEKFPEIRFPEFGDAWEQRKLGDDVVIISGDAPSKFDKGNELYIKVDDLNYNLKYVTDSQSKVAMHKSIKKVPKGSVIFPKRGAAIITNKVRILAKDSYMDTNMMALFSERIDTEFLYNVISNEGLYKIADTSSVPQINNKHIEPYEVMLPNLDEQRKIGKFFENIDNLITLHQRKLDHLKQLKKGFLQQMFV